MTIPRAVGCLTPAPFFLPRMAEHTDPQSLQVWRQRCTVIRDVALAAAGICGIESSDGLHDDGAIFDGACQWPAVVEGVRIGEDASAAYQAEGRHQTGETT